MDISINYAQEIVSEIGDIIKKNINLMDETGHIIASTDPDRIGDIHEGARDIVERRLEELYIFEKQATEGTRPGLNLAIKQDGKTVGVIGITGRYEDIYSYGKIVKKMTEILLREKQEEDAGRIFRRTRNRFLEEWVLEDGIRKYGQEFIRRGFELGIDVMAKRRVMMISILQPYGNTNQHQEQKMNRELEKLLEMSENSLFFRNIGRTIVLVKSREDEEMKSIAQNLRKIAISEFHIEVAIGIDGETGYMSHLNRRREPGSRRGW